MEIYKDMLEKLKFHKNNIINSFIKKNYYPTSEEIQAKIKSIDSRLAIFESYVSKPGDFMNVNEINYCFECIAKDIEILYKVLEDILINDYNQLNIYVEAALSELENKATYYSQRTTEETHSTTLGTTVFFQASDWLIKEDDEMNTIDLGPITLVQGMSIACFANISDIEDDKISFQFYNTDPDKSFNALPYNYSNNSYQIPGELGINEYPLIMPTDTYVKDYIKLTINEVDFNNKYKIAGAVGGMQVTIKRTGETFLYNFCNVDNAFVAEEDCFVEFYVLDGNVAEDSVLEYSFTEAPISANFSLQNGTIPLKKDAVKIFIECQKGLGMFFNITAGTVYASFEDAIISNKNTLIYKGNWDIRDFVLREYVRTNTSSYRVKVFIKSTKDISSNIESIYIKEVTV